MSQLPIQEQQSNFKDVNFDIVHIPILDATTGNTDIQTIATFLFDKQFDLNRVEQSWYQLVEYWPFLAARVRECKEAPSGLAYHIPKQSQYSYELEAKIPLEKRQFYRLDLSDQSIKSFWYGGAPRIFGENKSIPFICDAPKQQDLEKVAGLNSIKTFKELLNSDRTTFTAQATLFSDASLITISFAHIIGDGFCIRNILDGWSGLLRNIKPEPQSSTIPDNFLPLELAGDEAKLPLRFRLLGLRDKLRLMKNMFYDYQFRRPEKSLQMKYIHLPGDLITTLVKQANEELEKEYVGKKVPFRISRSDIALAFLVKNYSASLEEKNVLTPITIANARGRKVTGLQFDFSHILGGAAIVLPLEGLPVKEIRTLSIPRLASIIHHDISEQTSPDNVRNLFALTLLTSSWKRVHGTEKGKHKPPFDGKMPFLCSPDNRFVGMTDWRILQLSKVNFQGANLNKEDDGKPLMIKAVNARMITPFSHRDRFACIGDLDGSLWISGTLSEKEWNNKHGFGQYTHFNNHSAKTNEPLARL